VVSLEVVGFIEIPPLGGEASQSFLLWAEFQSYGTNAAVTGERYKSPLYFPPVFEILDTLLATELGYWTWLLNNNQNVALEIEV
jgi:hypothetical protein